MSHSQQKKTSQPLIVKDLEQHESLGMFEVTTEQITRLNALGLTANAIDLRDKGWTVFKGRKDNQFIDDLREAIIRNANKQKGTYFGITKNGGSCDMLLDKEDLFSEAVLNEGLHELMQIMCGKGYILSQLTGSVRYQGAQAMPLHCDQDFMPAPFPEHNAICTACWYLDEIATAEAGATKVVSASQKLLRHPTPREVATQENSEPILCGKGDIAIWDGRTWHSNYARSLPGERVLLHMTFTRLSYRPIEDYGYLSESFIAAHGGERLSELLGRNLWYGDREYNSGAVDMTKYEHTYISARR